MLTQRKVVIPIILGVWIISAAVAAYTCAILPSFSGICNYLLRQVGGSLYLAGVTKTFLHFHLIGVPLGLMIFGYGARLVRSAEVNAAHLAWYVSISVCLIVVWQVWVMLAERCLFMLLFPA